MKKLTVIVGSGASLRGFDFSLLDDERLFVMALNHEINRNRDAYTPDVWVVHDHRVANALHDIELDPKTRVYVPYHLEHFIADAGSPVPGWLPGALTYNVTPKFAMYDHLSSPHRPVVRANGTVATCAAGLAMWMEHTHIALLGCDCGGPYYDHLNTGGKTMQPDISQKMIAEWEWFDEDRDPHVTVYQCATDSPLAAFPKIEFTELLKGLGPRDEEKE